MENTDHQGFNTFSISGDKIMETLNEMVSTAKPARAFGEPITTGEYTVIPAAEVSVSLGAGFGVGSCPGEKNHHESGTEKQNSGGGGGGGGGVSMARPVATIEIGPHGVSVKPIVDFTKIGLALITAFGSMILIMGKMAKSGGERGR